MKNVVGWYNDAFNLGDFAFRHAFEKYLGDELVFTNCAWPKFDQYIFGAGGAPLDRLSSSYESGVITYETPIYCVGTDIPANGSQWEEFIKFNWRFISCRSKEYVRIANAQGLKVDHTPDVVFGYETPKWPSDRENSITVIPMSYLSRNHPHINAHVEDQLVLAIKKLSKSHRVNFMPFCFSSKSDYNACRKLCARTGVSTDNILIEVDPAKAIEFLTTQKLVITERFHGAIFSTIAATPFITISYPGKHTEFAKDNGLEFLHLDPLFDSEVLVEKARHLITSSDMVERLKNVTTANCQLVQEMFSGLRECLG